MTDERPVQIGLVPATVHGRYLRRPPVGTARGWLVGFHGYGQSGADFLGMLERIPSAREWLVVSVQALHPFYTRSQEVVANWMTREDREHAIADNIAYVDRVLVDLEPLGAPRALVFAGFSQGVAMAFRAAVRGRRACDAIVTAGGDVPPELELVLAEPGARRWPRVSMCTGSRDAFYTPSRLEKDVAFLRGAGADAQAHVFEGGHEWSPEVVAAADSLLSEIGR